MVKISIVICCYNSAARLPVTLQHIASLERPTGMLEVIIVDNNSKDNTADIASKIWSAFKASTEDVSFSVVKEPEPGLSSARRKGIVEAGGEYLIFVDDDNWLDKKFIVHTLELVKAYPRGGVFGGLGIPCFEDQIKPDWFDELQGYFAVGPQNKVDGDVTFTRGFVFGASSVWKKSILDKIILEPFILSDRMGSKLTSGGDTELCLKAVIQGYQIIYSKKLVFTHFIPKERLSKEYVYKMQADSFTGGLYMHGLMYKGGVQPEMFNHILKRTWWGQILISFKNLILFKRSFSETRKNVVEYLRINNKYNQSFR
jgi:glycosyltransferase involved in cell wall biosynthesis